MIIHIIPDNDILSHSEECIFFFNIPISKCECMPKVMLNADTGNGFVIKHSSFDGREALDEFNKIINDVSKGDDMEKRKDSRDVC